VNKLDGSVLAVQAKGFGTRVGFYTNIGSSIVALLSNFEKGSKEYNVLSNRYKWIRSEQGYELDKQKGLIIPKFPSQFVDRKKIKDDMTDEEKEKIRFNNSIVAKTRPYFFRYLYPHYEKRWKTERGVLDNICITKYGITYDEMLALPEKTIEQQKLINRYKRQSFFINNDSTMNRVSHRMEEQLFTIKLRNKQLSKEFDSNILLSKNFRKPNKMDLEKMKLLYKEYKAFKRAMVDKNHDFSCDEEILGTSDQIARYINKRAYATISSNSFELADMSLYLCYFKMGKNARNFCWSVFGKEIADSVFDKKEEKFVRVPMPSDKGSISYLWKNYGVFQINIKNDEE
jgi:hypothetical protein